MAPSVVLRYGLHQLYLWGFLIQQGMEVQGRTGCVVPFEALEVMLLRKV